MKKEAGIAFYDFDGTITQRDTMLELARFKVGSAGYYLKLATLVPHFVLFKSKLISNTRFKEQFLQVFFGGMPLAELQELANRFCATRLDAMIRPKALANIQQQLADNISVVVVTASSSYWVEPWCRKYGLGLLATQLEVQNGVLTGKLVGNNCHGAEKVARIKAAFDLSNYAQVYCYGDTPGDRPMLALASSAHYRPFE
ncbi:MAG TPA: HAD-IB family hydrolase [Phnomibacter sp.]|nr:HAD-IB family hydrolase [Phnomibacter sp.]